MIRIVVADDQALIRSALQALLEDVGDFALVGEAADGEAAVRAVLQHEPDVVLMDVRIPGLDGPAATRRIRSMYPDTAVIVLTTDDLDENVFDAVRAGASGFLLKDCDADELERAVRAAVTGEALMAPAALRGLMEEFTLATEPDPEAVRRVAVLSAPEREVLQLLSSGRTDDDIARVMLLDVATVEQHVGSILATLDVHDRTQAVVLAYEAGLRPGSIP